MKLNMSVVMVALLMLASGGASIALTRIEISQLQGAVNPATGAALVTMPNTSNKAWATLGSNCSLTGGVFNCTSTGSTLAWQTETPAGTVNGTNATFTLSFTPAANSLDLYWNGVRLSSIQGDYTISGATITIASANIPLSGDTLEAKYQH